MESELVVPARLLQPPKLVYAANKVTVSQRSFIPSPFFTRVALICSPHRPWRRVLGSGIWAPTSSMVRAGSTAGGSWSSRGSQTGPWERSKRSATRSSGRVPVLVRFFSLLLGHCPSWSRVSSSSRVFASVLQVLWASRERGTTLSWSTGTR